MNRNDDNFPMLCFIHIAYMCLHIKVLRYIIEVASPGELVKIAYIYNYTHTNLYIYITQWRRKRWRNLKIANSCISINK